MASLVELVAVNLRHYRILRGLKQVELAKKVGVSAKTLNVYENGKGGLSTKMITALAKALSIEESDLVNPGTPPKPVTREPDLLDAIRVVVRAVAEMDGDGD